MVGLQNSAGIVGYSNPKYNEQNFSYGNVLQMGRNALLHVPKMCVADKETPTMSDLRTNFS